MEKRDNSLKIKIFPLPNLHIVVILQKKWCHFFLAMKLYKKIIYLDSRENLGFLCKKPDLGVIFFFFWKNLARLARYRSSSPVSTNRNNCQIIFFYISLDAT